MKRAFIIFGRDVGAYEELVKFVSAIGLQQLSFEEVAGRTATSFVADIVTQGIREADVIIAFFTPDEQAALFDPLTASYVDSADTSRWQARPNVIFEAGLASGVSREKTIIVTLGADVQLFSDLHGIYYVDLAGRRAKEILRRKIESIVGSLPVDDNWMNPEISGDFASCLRPRWRHYDELSELESDLRHRKVFERSELTLWDVLVRTVVEGGNRVQWDRLGAADLMHTMERAHGPDVHCKQIVDYSYWWLLVHGVLSFNNIEVWFTDDETWETSVEYADLSKRGQRLLLKISSLYRKAPDSLPTLKQRRTAVPMEDVISGNAARRMVTQRQRRKQPSQ